MLIRRARWNLVVSALFVLAAGACGSTGGCGSCATTQPLPGGKLPADQTIEGGAQLRVTPHGIGTILSIVKPLLDQQLAGGVCVPGGDTLGGTVSYCETNQNGCTGGCRISPALNVVAVGPHPTDPQLIRAHVDASFDAVVPLHILIGTCDVSVRVPHLVTDIDVGLDIDAGSGELAIRARPITNLDFSGEDISSDDGLICQGVGGIVGIIVDLLHGTVADTIRDKLSTAVGSAIDTLVPKPLGLAGTMDVGNLLAGVLPDTHAKLETRLVPGGYAHMRNGGLSLGVITGLNADRDPSTRGPALSSEPALCVPALTRPALGGPPARLPPTTRSTYWLEAAAEFDGQPDPPGDVAIGVSETTLDLAGNHVMTSGALCLSVGTSLVKQLNVGTIGLIVRSLGSLASENRNDPVLLVTRPQRALNFAIGDNTAASPALSIGIEHLEVDFYALLYERYVRVLTLDLTLNAGVNLDFVSTAGMPARIRPMLVGIDAQHVQVKVLNSEFVKEKPEDLERLLPSVFDLITPALGQLPEITVPPLAGFQLENLSIRHVTTIHDDFLAIYATLGASSLVQQTMPQTMQPLAGDPRARAGLAAPGAEGSPASPSTGTARLRGVSTPDVDRVRGALLGEPGGAMPAVTFDVDRVDAAGRELEWSYRLDDGMWRTWRSDAPLVIADPAFAWQGKYTIGLASRVKGDYHTVSDPIEVPVIIDSVAPRIAVDQAVWQDDTYRIPAFDIVSGRALRYAFGKPGDAAPSSAWTTGGTIELDRDAAVETLDDRGQLAVFVRDEAGNTARAVIAPFHGQSSGGCACNTRGAPGAGGVLLLGVAGLVLRRRSRRFAMPRLARLAQQVRRRSVRRTAAGCAVWAAISAATALQPGCNCGNAASSVCETMADCSNESCAKGALAFCVDSMCTCSSDIILGKLGPYSDVAVGPDGAIWVSAYAQSHGDLVVARATASGRIPDEAWEWVDGVPSGPVLIPDSKIRGGIDDNGPDVGMYTSMAVGPDGVPMVSYFDRETASLKLAQKISGVWQIHVVDPGTGKLPATGPGALVGMYTSLTLRSDDGRPGIAYLAHVADARSRRAEVRFASAQTLHPSAAADWQTWVVDTAPLPPDDPASPAIYPLPEGLGLFVDSARMANQAPVVAYYDRSNGDLKVARFNVQSGQFTAARVLDGSNGVDAGWSPSVAIDARGVVNVAYVGSTGDDLKFVTDAPGAVPEIVDDGYRIDGTTADGLPKPVFHFVGADAGLVLPPGGAPMVIYQDATTEELLLAQKQPDGKWTHVSIAGATDPWPGGYGFFASGALGGNQLVMSSWVVNLPAADYVDSNWVEVFTRPLAQ